MPPSLYSQHHMPPALLQALHLGTAKVVGNLSRDSRAVQELRREVDALKAMVET